MQYERIIWRDYRRTEHDDFLLRVVDYIGRDEEASPMYDVNDNVCGWKIQDKYN